MEIVEGDIFTQTSGLIVHGCNAQGVMGSGMAAQVRAKYPAAYEAYKKLPTGMDAMGTFQVVKVTDSLYIGNCVTQLYFGRDGKKYADIQAIRRSIDSAFFWCDLMSQPLHTPEIGCGLGGLDWETDVLPLYQMAMEKYPKVKITLYRYKP